MKKLLLISLTTFLCLGAFSQKFLNITNGCTSIQIKISSQQTGKFYYVVFKTVPATDPTPSELKTIANSASITNIERKGVLNITAELMNDTVVHSIINIPNVTSNTPKLLYMYTVFENSSGVLENIVKQNLVFERKQLRKMFQSTEIKAGSLVDVPYAIYFPESYYHNPYKKYPLIIFFHGDGQKGVNYSNKYVGIENLVTDALPNYLDGSLNLDFIVLSPQIHGWDYTWSNTNFVFQLLTDIKSKHRIDQNKIYGIGCSGGGGGVYNFSSNYPEVFSGMSAISGVTSLTVQEYCNVKDIPFWGFHSDGDNTVNLNNLNVFINSVNACGPLVPPRKTVYKGNIHDCWKYPLRQDSIYRYFLAKTLVSKTNEVIPLVFDTNLTVVKNANGRSVIDFSGLPNNSEYQYFWYQKSGSDVLLQDLHTRTPSFINAALGNYKFRVMIKRPDGNTSYRDVLITVSNVVTTLDDVDLEHAFKTWQLYDPTGKKIREGNESKINLADLVTGMYIVNNENGRFKIYLK